MSRLKRAEAALAAAERWKKDCLLDGGSVFTKDKLWTLENFEQLREHYVEDAIVGKVQDFYNEMERRLKPAPPAAKCLFAEILWLYYLIVKPRAIAPDTKLGYIEKVWEWSEVELPKNHDALGNDLGQGHVVAGPTFKNPWSGGSSFFVRAMNTWFALPAEKHKSLLADPWEFAAWLDTHEGSTCQFRHVVLHFLFPNSFEPILAKSHKSKIIRMFSPKRQEQSNIDYKNPIAVDQTLLDIRKQLEKEHPDKEVDFYKSPFRKVWQPPEATQEAKFRT